MTDLSTYTPAPTGLTAAADYQTKAVQRLGEWATSAQAAFSVAQKLVDTSFVPVAFRGKPMEATAAILAGAEVGLSPMAALKSFDVIQGQAAPRAITLRAIVQSYGHQMSVVESTSTRCRMRGRRRGEDEWQTVTWTIDRARDLGLTGKDQWKKQPQTMLVARATSELARLIAADAILGIGYTAEEIADGSTGDAAPLDVEAPAADASASTGTRRLSRATARPAPQPEPEQPPVDVTVAPEAPDPEPATRPQITKIQAHFTDHGIKDRDEKLRILSEATGRTITSANDLTKAEAHEFIEDTERAAAMDTLPVEDEPTWPEDAA